MGLQLAVIDRPPGIALKVQAKPEEQLGLWLMQMVK